MASPERLDSQRRRGFSGEPEELRATLAEHLEELRGRLFRIITALMITMVIGWFVYPSLTQAMYDLAKQAVPKGLVFQWAITDHSAAFFLQLKFSFYIGVLIALPYAIFELYGFVKPGLRPHERKPLRTIVPISLVLFCVGAYLAWFILPITIAWFLGFVGGLPTGTVVNQDPEKFIMFQTWMIVAFGLGFQLPLITFFLAYIGIISPDVMGRYWRQATVGVFIVAATITPGGDIPSMMIMAVPLTLLFFASVTVAKWARGRNKADDGLDNLDG